MLTSAGCLVENASDVLLVHEFPVMTCAMAESARRSSHEVAGQTRGSREGPDWYRGAELCEKEMPELECAMH